MDRYDRAPAVAMVEKMMTPFYAQDFKASPFQDADDLLPCQPGKLGHQTSTAMR
jgi:hypothetical protein